VRARRVIVALTSALTLTACIGELPPPPAEGDAAPAGGAAPSAPVSVDPCPDLDGDGVAGCAGDCDDNAPWVSPERAERCNALDDDCDGRVDEGFETVGLPCETGVADCRAVGTLACSSDTLVVVCRTAVAPGTDEVPNRQDDDCDGRIDEGFANACVDGEVVTCDSPSLGVCRPGRATCVAGVFSACSGTAPSAELCNRVDDDCDGVVDETPTDVGTACGEGDACSVGVLQCVDGAQRCVPEMPRVDEVCDEADNDCDGHVDEGVLNACGDCGELPSETCDGEDNDCDRRIDENTAGPSGLVCVHRLARLEPLSADAALGRAVLVVPDVDGDGYADALVGAPGPDATTAPRPMNAPVGDVYLVSGKTGLVRGVLEGDGASYERGAALAVARLGPEGRVVWVVGTPGYTEGRNIVGRVEIVEPSTGEGLTSQTGSENGARFGAALATTPVETEAGERIIVGAPLNGGHSEGKVSTWEVDLEAEPPAWDKIDDVAGPNHDAQLGRRLAVASWPGAERPVLFSSRVAVDDLPDNSVAATNPLADFDALYALTPPAVTLTEATYGLGLAARERLVAVGAWAVPNPAGGDATGRAWLYDVETQAVVSEMVGGPGARLGAATLVTPPLKVGDRAGFCAGALGDTFAQNPSVPGFVRCDSPSGEPDVASRLRLLGDVPGDAFGDALDIGSSPDPDGRLLLVVGAPRTRVNGAFNGAVSIFRVAPLP